MKVAIGADHNGFALKQALIAELKKAGHQVQDLGAFAPGSVDYPDIAQKVAEAVGEQQAERGVLICGTGIGMSIAANKVNGVRAALCHDELTAQRSREHNDANVLCMAGSIDATAAQHMIQKFLITSFDGDKAEGVRHANRVAKITKLEQLSVIDLKKYMLAIDAAAYLGVEQSQITRWTSGDKPRLRSKKPGHVDGAKGKYSQLWVNREDVEALKKARGDGPRHRLPNSKKVR